MGRASAKSHPRGSDNTLLGASCSVSASCLLSLASLSGVRNEFQQARSKPSSGKRASSETRRPPEHFTNEPRVLFSSRRNFFFSFYPVPGPLPSWAPRGRPLAKLPARERAAALKPALMSSPRRDNVSVTVSVFLRSFLNQYPGLLVSNVRAWES